MDARQALRVDVTATSMAIPAALPIYTTRNEFLGSGVLLAPRVVVTCHHVVGNRTASELSIDTIACANVAPRRPWWNQNDRNSGEDDLALLTLAEPASAAPLPLIIGPLHAAELTPATAHGYRAAPDSGGDGFATSRRGEAASVTASPRHKDTIDAGITDFETAVIYEGMSGGPWTVTLADGTLACVGITAQGGIGRSSAVVILGGPVHRLLRDCGVNDASVRHLLREQLVAYLTRVEAHAAELPQYFPERLRRAAARGEPAFETLHQRARLIDRHALDTQRQKEAEQERLRAAGSLAAFDATPDDDAEPSSPPADSFAWDERQDDPAFRQVVVLGDPGFGKTWLLRREALRLAAQTRSRLSAGEDLTVPAALRVPVYGDLPDLARHEAATLEERLDRRLTEQGEPGTLRSWLLAGIRGGAHALLLDGWDEVTEQPHVLREQINTWAAAAKARLILASRTARFDESLLRHRPVLQLTAFDRDAIAGFTRAWFGDADTAQSFLTALDTNPPLYGLARSPLLLALLCRVYGDAPRALPRRRGELLERCLRLVMRELAGTRDEGVVEVRLTLLARAAAALFPNVQFQSLQLAVAAGYAVDTESHLRVALEYAETLTRQGLLIPTTSERQRWQFLHRSFHEYLTARALSISANEGSDALMRQVERTWHDPVWHEVIALAPATLVDPEPLLRTLADPARDDRFRPRLALAARIVSELTPEHLERHDLRALADRVSSDTFDYYMRLSHRDIEPAAPFLTLAVVGLASANRPWGARPFATRLAEELRVADVGTFVGLRDILAATPAAASPDIIDALAGRLSDPSVASLALRALLRVIRAGLPSSLRAHIIAVMTGLARHAEPAVRRAALETLGALESGPMEALSPVIERLGDDDASVRTTAFEALASLGRTAPTSAMVDAAAAHLSGENAELAASTLVAFGAAAARPGVLERLYQLWVTPCDSPLGGAACRDAARRYGLLAGAARDAPALERIHAALAGDRSSMRSSALLAFGSYAQASRNPEMLERLLPFLRDDDDNVRLEAETALVDFGPEGATMPVLDALLDLVRFADLRPNPDVITDLPAGPLADAVLPRLASLLADADADIQAAAYDLVLAWGPAVVRGPVLDALLRDLEDPVPHRRVPALTALDQLWNRADLAPAVAQARPDRGRDWIVTAVLAHVRDPRQGRDVAIRLLAKLCREVASAGAVDFLLALSRRGSPEAIAALGRIGPPVLDDHPDVIDLLVNGLEHTAPRVREQSAVALGSLGPRAATSQVLAALGAALDTPLGPQQAVLVALESMAREPSDAVVELLLSALQQDRWMVRRQAAAALGNVQRQGTRIKVGPAAA